MNAAYKARRAEKHAAQAAARIVPETFPVAGAPLTIDLTPKAPRLAWLGGRLFKSSTGGRKNASGHSLEHEQANHANRNPYLNNEDGKWYWYGEDTGMACETGYVTREQAEIALNDYDKWLNNAKEVVGEIMENSCIAQILELSKNPAIVAELAERGQKFDVAEIERSIGGDQ